MRNKKFIFIFVIVVFLLLVMSGDKKGSQTQNDVTNGNAGEQTSTSTTLTPRTKTDQDNNRQFTSIDPIRVENSSTESKGLVNNENSSSNSLPQTNASTSSTKSTHHRSSTSVSAGTSSDETVWITPKQKGDRIFGLVPSFGSGSSYERSYTQTRTVGSELVELSIAWDQIEKTPHELANENLAIANIYYKPRGSRVAFTLPVIDTNNLRLPSDLEGKAFNDPEVIARFKLVIDYVFASLADTDLVSFSVSNEADVYLNAHPSEWDSYIDFYKQIASYIHSKNASISVGSKGTFDGLMTHTELQRLNQYSDVILVTYYPIDSRMQVRDPNTVFDDFKTLVNSYGAKPIYLLEVGYPSGAKNGSSEEKQSLFVQNVFDAWDIYRDKIKVVNLMMINDASPSDVAMAVSYYGVSLEAFASYLGTLGLRNYDETEKSAFATLKKELENRGW